MIYFINLALLCPYFIFISRPVDKFVDAAKLLCNSCTNGKNEECVMTKKATNGIESEQSLSDQFPEKAAGKPPATLRVVTPQNGPQEQQQNVPDDQTRRDQEHPHGGGLGL